MRRPSDPITRKAKAEKRIPFEFVLEALEPVAPETRPMFGCTAVYVDERVVFMLRDKGDSDSGVWVAFQPEHRDEVLALFPRLLPIDIFGDKVSGWRKLAVTSPEFEEDVLAAVKLARARDPRLGKVPGAKKKSATKKAPPKKPPPKRQRPK